MSVELREYRHGRLLYLPNDQYVGRLIHEHGEYSEGEVDLFRKLLCADDLVIEAGANIGALTIPLAHMAKEVFAFEPQRAMFNILCGNIALNGLSRKIRAYQIALGDENTTVNVPSLNIDASNNFGGLSLMVEHKRCEVFDLVPLVKIDTFCAGQPVKLIKADVEGMEAEVLLGAKQVITAHRPFLYVENDRVDRSERLLGLMQDFGYRLYTHEPYYLSNNKLFYDPHYGENVMLKSSNVLGVPHGVEFDIYGIADLVALI